MKKIEKIDCEGKEYPKKLLAIKNSPKIIYAIGNISLLNSNKKSIAIIGSRDCTEYGRNTAFKFANSLAKAGNTIISGMAIGIDAVSHIGAMEEIGRTIAVLGGGFNKIYPKQNEWLFYEIIKNKGCIISEYEPNEEASSEKFLQRNRIVSGLSDAVLVVEAEYRSGTSVTAKIAKEQNKILFAVPSNLESKNGIGTNKLLQEGAKIAIDYKDIIKELKTKNEKIKSKKMQENLEIVNENKEYIELKEEYKPIYNLLLSNPKNINELSKMLDVSISKLNSILTFMQIEGIVKQLPGNEFIVNGESKCIKNM